MRTIQIRGIDYLIVWAIMVMWNYELTEAESLFYSNRGKVGRIY